MPKARRKVSPSEKRIGHRDRAHDVVGKAVVGMEQFEVGRRCPVTFEPRTDDFACDRPSMANCSPADMAAEERGSVALALELGKVMGDHSNVETPQNRLVGLAIKQELERRLDATLRRLRAHRQSFASVSCHRDVMPSLAVSNTDDDLEFEWRLRRLARP
jgi:hypothetical protein